VKSTLLEETLSGWQGRLADSFAEVIRKRLAPPPRQTVTGYVSGILFSVRGDNVQGAWPVGADDFLSVPNCRLAWLQGFQRLRPGSHFTPSICGRRIRSRRVSWVSLRRWLERSPPSDSISPIVDTTGPHPGMGQERETPVMARCRRTNRLVQKLL